MKILLYDWEALSQKGLINALKKRGYEVIIYSKRIENHILDEGFIKELAVKLVTEKIDLVFSFNFFSQVSLACQAVKKIYVSWIYSCPNYYMETNAAYYEGNFFFVFDRNYAIYFQEKGFPNVFHLPLAVDPNVFRKTNPKNRDYGFDISFVGTMYSGERNYFEQIQNLSPYWKGYIEGICEAQQKVFGFDMIRASMSKELITHFRQLIKFDVQRDMTLSFEEFMINNLQRQVTVLERSRYLDMLSQKYETALFTKYSSTREVEHLKNIILCKPVDYYDEMPEVFRQSKINLNITLRSITSGIPLRVFDILGSGGFLLTNYQEEIAENFENGKELVMWSSEEELKDLCGYYLKHDEERQAILQRGYEKVSCDFSYDVQIEKIMNILMG